MKQLTIARLVLTAAIVTFAAAPAGAASVTITSVAGFPNGRTFNDLPANAIDHDTETYTWTTNPNTVATPANLAIGFDAITVNRLRLWKDNNGGGGENIKNLTIQYTTDSGALESRTWITVSGLTSGYLGTELLHATSVNSDGTVTGDVHNSPDGDDWGSLTFDAVNATGLLISFSNPTVPASAGCTGLGPPNNACNHYHVAEFEAYSAPSCGNGNLDGGEQCDDGSSNGTLGSCCSGTCQLNEAASLCDDGDADTSNDACSASGECAGTDLCAGVTCSALDQCHAVGVCDHATGVCSNPLLADGAECNDGDGCTENDVCTDGMCGGAPVHCDDGNVCTQNEQCVNGACTLGTPLLCDDGQICNGVETCNPQLGCQAALNALAATPCNDALYCNGTESCDGNGACVANNDAPCSGTQCNHCQEATDSCFDPASAQCDDADSGTVQDVCDGEGTCAGVSVTGSYAILRWPQLPAGTVAARLGFRSKITGRVCTDTVLQRPYVNLTGDVVGLAATGTALTFRRTISAVSGDLVTHGGSIAGLDRVAHPHPPIIDASGNATALMECDAGSARAASRYDDWSAAVPESDFGAVNVAKNGMQTIPSAGTFGAGAHVVHADAIEIGPHGTLQLAGSAATTQIVIVVGGMMKLHRGGKVALQGLTSDQVMIVVEGTTTLQQSAQVAASLLSTDKIRLGWRSTIDGQVLGAKEIKLRQYVTVNGNPFAGW